MPDSDPVEAVPPARRQWPRRLMWGFGGLLIVLGASMVSLPWVLGTDSARRWMLSRADATLAPARLEVVSFRFSWLGPTRMAGFSIIDADGEAVVMSERAVWDRNLFQILFDRPRYGTLSLEAASLDVERDSDGRVDLYEALKPVLNGPPETSLTILARGRLRLSSPGLERPIEGRDLALKIRRPPAPEPISWSLQLSEPAQSLAQNASPTLSSQGRYDRWKPGPNGPHDLVFSIEGQSWPLWVDVQGVQSRASWTGRVDPSTRSGLWRFEGRGTLNALRLQGPRLQNQTLELDRLTSAWSVSETADGWRLDSLDALSDLGEVKTIPDPSGRSWTALEGRLDLAETARRLSAPDRPANSLSVERGQLRFQLERPETPADHAWNLSGSLADLSIRQGDTSLTLAQPAELVVTVADSANSAVSARIAVPDLVWSGAQDATQMGPLAIEAEADYQDRDQSLELSQLSLSSPWGRLLASGQVADLGGSPLASLSGTIEPDWEHLNARLSTDIEPGARILGQPAAFSVQAPLSTDLALDELEGMLALKFDLIDIYGMRLGDLAISTRAARGTVVIDPIVASLNGGQVRLNPLVEHRDNGSWTLRLDSGSRIEGAQVNDEVSRRVLSYIAPVLDRATRVNGRISATFSRAEFPLGPDLARGARVEGNVVFDDVVFEPGPLATNLMALAGRQARTITLDEPVLLTIADGKVHQTGLKVPIGNLTEFSLSGDIGFDRSIDLTASIPMSAQMVPNLPVVGSIVHGARVNVPITGTLAQPKIDRDQFRAELRTLERQLLQRTATQGAAELIFRLAQPRPRGEDGLTPRERRQQRRMERRQEREETRNP